MELPFERPEFIQVFSEYNESIWPAQIIAAVLGLVAGVLFFFNRSWAHRTIATIVAVFWMATGMGYHWLFFSRISAAAPSFGILSLIAAFVFLTEGTVRNRIRFEFKPTSRGWLAVALIGYSLVIYPLLGLFLTHPYPETPLFGVTPCPTTIFTLGLLVAASHPKPLVLAAVPLLWAVIGGTAAILLEVPGDWGLVVAAIVFLATAFGRGKNLFGRMTA